MCPRRSITNFKSVVTIHSWVSSMSWASYAQVTNSTHVPSCGEGDVEHGRCFRGLRLLLVVGFQKPFDPHR